GHAGRPAAALRTPGARSPRGRGGGRRTGGPAPRRHPGRRARHAHPTASGRGCDGRRSAGLHTWEASLYRPISPHEIGGLAEISWGPLTAQVVSCSAMSSYARSLVIAGGLAGLLS